MALLLARNKYFLLLALIFIIAEILVNPLGNFPLNDDWSYSCPVNTFCRTGEIDIGSWPAMTLCTQILWGYVFTKLFGFSFFVLRCSTLLATLIGMGFLNKLITQISGNKTLALFSCLVLLFNPLVFNLSNTFMTDANFNTLVIICCYFMYNFFRTRSVIDYSWFVIFSGLLVLLRQYGIIVPAGFIVASLFVKERRARALVLAALAFGLVLITLKLYEVHLHRVLMPGAAYKFSGNMDLLSRAFWDNLFASFTLRRREILIHLLSYPMPVAALFLVSLIKQARWWLTGTALLCSGLLVYCLLTSQGIMAPSTFMSAMLGNESFHESRIRHHNDLPAVNHVLNLVQWGSCFITIFVLMLGLANTCFTKRLQQISFSPQLVFFVLLIFSYSFMIIITESYFDRYHIPLITTMVILLAYFDRHYKTRLAPGLLPLVFWAYISIGGTKDYLAWNRKRMEAYWYLRSNLHIPADRINAGDDMGLWNEGNSWYWRDCSRLEPFDYLIQYEPEADFVVPLKVYEFQRYYPYKKDKINIFVRTKAPGKSQPGNAGTTPL